jgi:hypothetical protein
MAVTIAVLALSNARSGSPPCGNPLRLAAVACVMSSTIDRRTASGVAKYLAKFAGDTPAQVAI